MTEMRSYQPGQWFAVLGEDTAVLLPPDERRRVAALWDLVDGGASADEVLDALVSGGLRELSGFVLLTGDAGTTTAVVRGDGAVVRLATGDGEVTVTGAGARTWTERTVGGVTGVDVEVGGDGADGFDGGPGSTIGTGLVRVSRLRQPAETAPAEPAPAEPAPAETAPAETAPGWPPPVAPVPAAPAAEPSAPEPPAPESPAAEPSAPPAPEQLAEESDPEGDTRAGGPSPEPPRPGIPGQPQAPGVLSRPVARLVLSSGDVVDVDRAVVVGRAPEARRHEAGDQSVLVTVPSPQKEISSTHLEIRPGSGADHGAAVVTDLGSTNGTVLMQPGLPAEELTPGVAVSLLPGAIIDLGDSVTIQVTTP